MASSIGDRNEFFPIRSDDPSRRPAPRAAARQETSYDPNKFDLSFMMKKTTAWIQELD